MYIQICNFGLDVSIISEQVEQKWTTTKAATRPWAPNVHGELLPLPKGHISIRSGIEQWKKVALSDHISIT